MTYNEKLLNAILRRDFSSFINKVVYIMEATTVEFLDIMHEPGK